MSIPITSAGAPPIREEPVHVTDPSGIKKSFLNFSLKVHELDQRLEKFGIQERKRVPNLLPPIASTREMLKRTREAFFHNATVLVPGLVEQARNDFNQFQIPQEYFNERLPLYGPLPTVLEELAARFRLLHAMINELRESTDEGLHLKSLLLTLDRDLMYYASCARFYSDRSDTRLFQRYIHQFMDELPARLEHVTTAVGECTLVGVPAISYKGDTLSSSNLAVCVTVSTFFSSVAATTLQMSMSESDPNHAVNLLWFISIIFSVGATLNSFTALLQKEESSRFFLTKHPLFRRWTELSPFLYLGISNMTFLVGLIVFAFTSNQASYTPYVALTFTLFIFFVSWAIEFWGSPKVFLKVSRPVLRQGDIEKADRDLDEPKKSTDSSILLARSPKDQH